MRHSTRVCLLGVLVCLSLSVVSANTMESEEKALVDDWLLRGDLDQVGNPRGTMYTGGSPLFDESTGRNVNKYEYIARAHPEKPWAAGGEEERASAPRASQEESGEMKATTIDDDDEKETDDDKPAASRFPTRWGPEPLAQTRDYRELPGDYGFGSSTLARWIETNIAKDTADEVKEVGDKKVEKQAEAPAPKDLKRMSSF